MYDDGVSDGLDRLMMGAGRSAMSSRQISPPNHLVPMLAIGLAVLLLPSSSRAEPCDGKRISARKVAKKLETMTTAARNRWTDKYLRQDWEPKSKRVSPLCLTGTARISDVVVVKRMQIEVHMRLTDSSEIIVFAPPRPEFDWVADLERGARVRFEARLNAVRLKHGEYSIRAGAPHFVRLTRAKG